MMGQKRTYDDFSAAEPPTPTSSESGDSVQTTGRADDVHNKKSRNLEGSSAADAERPLAVRVQEQLNQIFEEAVIPSSPWQFSDINAYFARIGKIRDEFLYAMHSLKEESLSVRKPFQRAYSLSILPLKIEYDRWKRVDRFYEIHLTRARCAYIRHVWKSSSQDHYCNTGGHIKDMVEYLPAVESLLLVPDDVGVTQAYNLIFYLAGYLYIRTNSISPHAENEEFYALIDAMLLRVINRRLKADEAYCDNPAWLSDGLSKFNKASDRFRHHGVHRYLRNSISRLTEVVENGPYKPNGWRDPSSVVYDSPASFV